MKEDALSNILRGLRLTAEIYLHTDFCGTWAVDTSGQRQVPFHLINSGQAWLHQPDQKPIPLSSGDLVVFPHDSPHTLSNSAVEPDKALVNQLTDNAQDLPTTNMVCGFFDFNSSQSWPLLDSLDNTILLSLQDTRKISNTMILMNLLISELENQQQGSGVVVDELAYVLFIHILRSQIEKGINQGLLAALFDPKIGIALNKIHQQPSTSWTLERLAQEIAMSRSAFADKFKHLVGKTPMRYLAEWRMRQASELLMSSDLNVALIAEECGYQSEVAFRKAFKSIIGQTPGQFRSTLLKE
ncbi:AraC family transcriptional regulator [Pleionea sp. CnH1-48]|uniref:AraC family transcriptional regulator n=1 Tax=Pleionea sp. CnH1-48 TaxID=2954494 RepID=UPI0020972B28|nr:AraC family transcriptional regulator [Pleionea sp. CnH1-48]MCO7226529.1 AraC family transcriptional regulator [Pleionea sp. CnH1-48]